MILIVDICKEPLHYLEFVKPIEKIVFKREKFLTKHYNKLTEKDLRRADRIIICGTSLKDNNFLKDIKKFRWIKEYKKPILGICAGMQIISLVYGARLKKETEIGFYREQFKETFLNIFGEQKVYHLHNNYTSIPKDFESFTKGKIPQAIKHKTRDIYGILFHPEVRNEEIIHNFILD